MNNLRKIIKTTIYEYLNESKQVSDNEEIQTLVDIIDGLEKDSEKRNRYINMLKTNFNYDYIEPSDEEYIDNPNLNDIKSIDDFTTFSNYRRYAMKIVQLRYKNNIDAFHIKAEKPNHDKNIKFNVSLKIGELLGFDVKYGVYDGDGNYASAHSDYTIKIPDNIPASFLIHEIGHIYDYKFYKDGISKIITNSVTVYGTTDSGETFAENFVAYFVSPKLLKNILPHVYIDLDNNISPKWKMVINNLLK
jgi:hypothetical protein